MFSWWLLVTSLSAIMAADDEPVTCGSAVKIVNRAFDVRLHSPDVKYGMGSGQQSVTGIKSQTEVGSNWQVKANSTSHCRRGVPVECGSVVRLENLEFHKNLHSHVNYEAPISTSELEVSIFGEGGIGDSGDDWEVICNTDFWRQSRDVMFQHIHSRRYLAATGRQYSEPIRDHVEVVAARVESPKTKWRTAEGIFIKTVEMNRFIAESSSTKHDEL